MIVFCKRPPPSSNHFSVQEQWSLTRELTVREFIVYSPFGAVYWVRFTHWIRVKRLLMSGGFHATCTASSLHFHGGSRLKAYDKIKILHSCFAISHGFYFIGNTTLLSSQTVEFPPSLLLGCSPPVPSHPPPPPPPQELKERKENCVICRMSQMRIGEGQN